MKRISAILFLASLLANLAFGQTSSPPQQKERERWPDGKYKWTTDVSVSMTEYTPGPSVLYLPRIYPSPDGKYFFLLSWRGDVARCKCTYRTLYVYETQAVREWLASSDAAYPKPFRTLQRSTQLSQSPIGTLTDPSWDGSGSIVFTGWDEDEELQGFRLDVASGKLQQMTNEKGLRQLYIDGEFGGGFRDEGMIYRRDRDGVKETAPTMIEPAPRRLDGNIYLGEPAGTTEWIARSPEGKTWTLPGGWRGGGKAAVSPGGGYAVMVLADEVIGKPVPMPNRFVMVDIRKEKVTKIADLAARAQVGLLATSRDPSKLSQALWTADASEVIFMNAALPAKDVPAGGNKDGAYIAAYELKTGRWRVLEELKDAKDKDDERVGSVGWLTDGKELLVAREKDGKPTGGTVYSRQGDKWGGRSVDASVQLKPVTTVQLERLNVFVKQGMNDPQVVMASDGKNTKAMTPPDPALKNVGIAQMRPFEFAMPDGSKLTVGLTLPIDFKPGSRLPLVIQNSYFKPDSFLPDGHAPTGLARQALVAQGFAVVDFRGFGETQNPTTEGPNFVARVDAAVEALAKEGIVDPARVGLVGHSRMGWRAHYAATHPGKVKLVAAGVIDSVTVDYVDLLNSQVYSYGVGSEAVNGGPFWQNKEKWLERDVRFNADRVETAMLFVDDIAGQSTERIQKDHAALTMAALQANRRPFDYIFLHGAGHAVLGAVHRKALMDLTVDWMNFWIQRKEDPDPAKAEQYRRWRMIRERNEQRKAEEAKLGKSNSPSMTAAATPTPQPQAQQTSSAAQVPDEAAIQRVKEELKAAGIPEPQNIFPLNIMGYREMYVEKDMVKAEKLFRWNLILFPNRRGTSSITDSMAEYYIQAGNIEKAIEFYTRSLELRPNFPSKAPQIIQRLKADPNSLGAIQEEQRQAYIAATKSNPGE